MKQTDIKYIVVHCSATRPDQECGVKEIDQMHKDRGWSGIGYHYVVRRDGSIEVGRPLTNAGAHVFGYNRESWGVCLEGGLDDEGNPKANYNGTQLRNLRQLLTTLSIMAPGADVRGHRDFSPDVNGDGVIDKYEYIKACPCFDANRWYVFGEMVE